MPRKSTPSAASKEAAASSKVEKADQDTPRRSGRAAAKVESSPGREAGRSRRSSTAAQTAASVAESRVTRSRTSVGTRKTSSSPSESSSSKSGKEVGVESPASRVRSSRRSTGRVNYKESDGEEESRTRKKLLDEEEEEEDDADDDFNESEGEEEESAKGSSKRKAPNSASKATPVKGKSKSEKVSNRRQSKSKSVEDKDEKDTPGRKRKESESVDETSSSTRRSTRVRQSSGTPSNKGSRRSSRGSTSQPAATQKKRSSRGKSEPEADAGVDEGEDVMDAQETEESHSQEGTAEETKTSDENTKKRKMDSDAEEAPESEQKRIKLDSKVEDAGEASSVDEIKPEEGTEDDIEKSSVDDKIQDKEESDSASDEKDVKLESKRDSVDEIKDVSSVEKEQSDEEPMEVDQDDVTPADAPVSDEKQKSSEVSVVDKPVVSKPEEPKSPLPSVEPPESEVSKGEECIEENVEPIEIPSPKDSEPEPKEKEDLPKSKEEEVIDIASGSENEGESSPAEKGTKKAEMSPPVHDVDNSDESSSPTPIPSSECVEKVPHIIDKIEDVDLDSPTPSGDATASADKDTDKNIEILSGDRQTASSESSQSSSDRGNVVPDSKENVEYVNIQEDTNKSDSDVNCLESPENTNTADTENSSNAFLSLEQDKESSLNGVHSNSDDSIKSIEIVGDGVSGPFPGGKESRVEEQHPVPKANGAHDGIHDDGAAQDQSVLVSSSRRYVFNSSLKEDVLSLLKDKKFEFASYNLGCIVEDGSSQKDELISELNKLKADVICLQEVTKRFYQDVLEPRLDALGYNGILSVPEENSPGIASFHKSTVFRLTKHSEASLRKLIEKDLEASSLDSADKAAVHSYLKKCGNVLFTQYSSIKGENTLTVANVSMPSSDISTHALQMSCLARELVTVIEGASKPLLLCGTFNMLEGEAPYQLLRDGYLSNDMIEELQRKKDIILPGKENAALVNLLWKAFQHPSSNLCSCYASVLGHELSIPGGSKPTSPDLLWFSSDCLHTVGVLDVAPSSREGPKDHHVALKATVAFSN